MHNETRELVALHAEARENAPFDCERHRSDDHKHARPLVDETEEYERNAESIKNREEHGRTKIVRERHAADGSGKLGGCRSNRGHDSVAEGMS